MFEFVYGQAVYEGNQLHALEIDSRVLQVSFANYLVDLFLTHNCTLLICESWFFEFPRDQRTALGMVVLSDPDHATLLELTSGVIHVELEELVVEEHWAEVVLLTAHIWVIVVYIERHRLVEEPHGNVSVECTWLVFGASDLEDGVKGFILLADVVNGVHHFVSHPQVAPVVYVPVVRPEEGHGLVVVETACVVPVFHASPVVVGDRVEQVRGACFIETQYTGGKNKK